MSYELPTTLLTHDYEALDPCTRDMVQVGDYVKISVSFPDNEYKKSRFVCISGILDNGQIKGHIHDYQIYNQNILTCDVCDVEQSRKEINDDPEYLFHSCNGLYESFVNDDWCDFHCHAKCLSKVSEIKGEYAKKCPCALKEIPFQNNKEIMFDRKYICEITDWSPNGEKLCSTFNMGRPSSSTQTTE